MDPPLLLTENHVYIRLFKRNVTFYIALNKYETNMCGNTPQMKYFVI